MNSIIEFIIMLLLAIIYFKWILPNCVPDLECALSNEKYKTSNNSRQIETLNHDQILNDTKIIKNLILFM